MASRTLCFAIAIAAIILAVLVSGCTQPGVSPGTPTPSISPPTTLPGTTPSVSPPPTVPPTTPEAAVFDVNINSLTCVWTKKTVSPGVTSDCVRILSQGTARGPVGARLELPILAWSDDTITCNNWTVTRGALIAVGSTCTRQAGQPATTTWTVDTGPDTCPLRDYFNSDRSHTVKIYHSNDLTPQQVATKSVVCR